MSIHALLFDLSGVLYEGDACLPGAVDTIARAREQGLTLRFVTNTATKSREQILAKLGALGIEVKPDELFTAPDAAVAYLAERQQIPYALVHPAIAPLFRTDAANYNCVVLGDARDGLNYATMNTAFRLLMDGCPLLGIGDNRYFRDTEGLSLDAGPFIHALAYAADVEPVIMGKPSALFFAQVVASTGLTPEQCLMIGDDVFGDVEGALNAGVQAALVQTGKYRLGDEHKLSRPAPLIAGVADLWSLL